MQIKNVNIKDLVPYEKNTKRHDKKQIANVAESIRQYGFVQPIVIDKNNEVVIGHCRLLAAKKLKLKEVPCVCVDDLTEEQVKSLRIADNKTNESEWDIDTLFEELTECDFAGFDFDFFENEEQKEKAEEKVINLEKMELKQFEHYDYVVFLFKNELDYLSVIDEFKLKKVDAGFGDTKKVGLGRVINGKELLERLKH